MSDKQSPGQAEWWGNVLKVQGDYDATKVIIDLRDGGHISPANRTRIRECLNACIGIADPETAVPALVEALRYIVGAAEPHILLNMPGKHVASAVVGKARAALALVEPKEREGEEKCG